MAVFRGNLNLKSGIRKFSSALYITGDKAQTNFVVLTPFIDFDEQIQHKSKFVQSVEARKLCIDFEKIEKRWHFFKVVDGRRELLEITRNEIYNCINKLKHEDSEKNKAEIDKLLLHAKLVKDDLKNVKEYSYGIEESANLAVLTLPNLLHPKTPISEEIVIHEFLNQPEKIDKNHMEIGRTLNLIEYTDPTFYFLKSEASLFEFAITNYFHGELHKMDLINFSNADFARSIVVEGCGVAHLDNRKIFTLQDSSELNKLHLVGGGSLYSFMAYFTKNVLKVSSLPLKLFSLGRKYNPVDKKSGMFDLSQSSVAQVFVVTEDDQQKMDETFDLLTKEIIKLYEALGYHFRVVYAPAQSLENCESLKISIEMFSNYLQKYIEVGHLSVYDNYLSKRLLCTYVVNKENKFVKIIGGQVLNIQKVLGCALENNCEKPLLNNVLQSYL